MPSNYGRNRKCRGTLALSNGIVAFRQNVLPTCTGEAKVVVTDRKFRNRQNFFEGFFCGGFSYGFSHTLQNELVHFMLIESLDATKRLHFCFKHLSGCGIALGDLN